MYMVCCGFFFFKQKTAYEMRISDWSSDVCSSDLEAEGLGAEGCSFPALSARIIKRASPRPKTVGDRIAAVAAEVAGRQLDPRRRLAALIFGEHQQAFDPRHRVAVEAVARDHIVDARLLLRSEEHTSELQSLMLIPYAGFCLKKKNNKQTTGT